MKTTNTNSNLTKNILSVALATGAVLLIPAVAMQFTTEVNWELADFVAVGTLLLVTGLAYVLISPKLATKQQRLILAAILIAFVLSIWAEMAVGIFTTWGG